MSKFYIDTEAIRNLSADLKNLSKVLSDAKEIPSTISNRLHMSLQQGYNLSSIKAELRSLSKDIASACSNLDLLATGLEYTLNESASSDILTLSKFFDIPASVLTGERIVGNYDITAEFINNADNTLHSIAIGLAADPIENLKGLLNNIFDWAPKMWDTLPEKIVRDSLTKFISELLKDENFSNQNMDKFKGVINSEQYENLMQYIDTALETGKLITEADIADICRIDVSELRENDFLRFLLQEDNLHFLSEISDRLENTTDNFNTLADLAFDSSDIIQKIFGDFYDEISALENIRRALLDSGYNNDTVNSVIDQMLFEYRNQYYSAAFDCVEHLSDIGIDVLIDGVGGKTLTTLLTIKDTACSLVGLDDQADYLSTIYATNQYSDALVDKYEYYSEKIQSGNYNQADVEQCSRYLSMATTAKIQEYDALVKLHEDALNSVSGVFASAEDRESVTLYIQKLKNEITRLENMRALA